MARKNQTYFLIGVLVVILGLLIMRTQARKNNYMLQSPPSVNSNASAPQIVNPSNENSPTSPAASNAMTHVLTQKIIEEKKLGMIGMELPKEGETSILNIELKIKPSCTPGDADAMAMELKATPSHHLLGTLEGMSQGSESFYWEVPEDFLTVGTAQKQFKIKTTDEPIQYGFYLCTAKSGDKTCQDKKVVDINKIFTEHLTKQDNLGTELRVIFFQYLLLDQFGLSVFEQIPKGTQKINELKAYSKEKKFQGNRVEEGIDRAQKELQTLFSLPIQLEKDKIGLELPKYDAAACAAMQKK